MLVAVAVSALALCSEKNRSNIARLKVDLVILMSCETRRHELDCAQQSLGAVWIAHPVLLGVPRAARDWATFGVSIASQTLNGVMLGCCSDAVTRLSVFGTVQSSDSLGCQA